MCRCLLVPLLLTVALFSIGCSTTQTVDGNQLKQNSKTDSKITYPANSVVWYSIKRGDNLPLIASEVTGNSQNWNRIASFNNIENPASIEVGQIIYIPKHMLPAKQENGESALATSVVLPQEETTSPIQTTSPNAAATSNSTNTLGSGKSNTHLTKYTCSELTSKSAYSLLASGHSYLDRDGDGHPCEWGKTRTTKKYSGGGKKCHTVRGYRRKNGTYVRGHTRCR